MCRPSSNSDSLAHHNVETGGGGIGSGTIPAAVRVLMPNHPACAEALALAKSSLPPSILYHSFRVFLYAQAFLKASQGELEGQQQRSQPTTTGAGESERSILPPTIRASASSIEEPRPVSSSAASSTLVDGSWYSHEDDHSTDTVTNSRAATTSIPAPALIATTPTTPYLTIPTITNHPHEQAPPFPDTLLFVGCILHDIGTSARYNLEPQRFEVVGADVAVKILHAHFSPSCRFQDTHYLSAQHLISQQIMDIWLALALHTSPGIAERIGGVVSAVRLAVRADFGSHPPPPLNVGGGSSGAEGGDGGGGGGGGGIMNVVKWGLPRLEIEKELGDAVVRGAVRDRRKAPGGSWPGDLLRARDEDPGWEGVNKGF